jgi:hypothetical protein
MNEPVPEVLGDFIPLRVTFDREPHVICVGHATHNIGPDVARVQVNGHYCGIIEGKWASPPIPYYPGMKVTVKFIDGQGDSKTVDTVLPGPDQLGPVFGPDWTPFAPLE